MIKYRNVAVIPSESTESEFSPEKRGEISLQDENYSMLSGRNFGMLWIESFSFHTFRFENSTSNDDDKTSRKRSKNSFFLMRLIPVTRFVIQYQAVAGETHGQKDVVREELTSQVRDLQQELLITQQEYEAKVRIFFKSLYTFFFKSF